MFNPFHGVQPSLGPFEKYLGSPMTIGLGIALALALVYASVHLIPAALSFIRARRSGRPHQAEEALKDMLAPAISIVCIILVPVIYLAIVSIAQTP